jgi:hypothetical protein
MIGNDWSLTIQERGEMKMQKTGALRGDKFTKLVSRPGDEKAVLSKVSMTVNDTYECEGGRWIKVGAMVSLTCDQNETTINKAAELAFFKAQEVVEDGLKAYGIQQ